MRARDDTTTAANAGDATDSERVPGRSARRRLVGQFAALVPGVLYVYDLERDGTVFVNTQVSRILGWDEAEIDRLGDGIIRTLLHPDDAAGLGAHLAALRSLADGESRIARCRFRHADGSYRWFENRDSVLTRHPDGHVVEIIGVATDVTHQVHTEQALRVAAEQDRFRAELGDELRGVQTPEEAERLAARLLGDLLRANRVRFTPVLEGTPELSPGRALRIDDVAADRRLTESVRRRYATAGVQACVLVPVAGSGADVTLLAVEQGIPRVWTDGEVALIEETAERTRATVERALAVAALSEREASYRSLFSSIDEGFCLCEMICDADGEPIDYRFLEVNDRFPDHTGLHDPVGHTARELVPDLEMHWVQAMARVGLGGETLRYSDSAESMNRHFDVFAAPVAPIGGGRFLVVVNDVTERKQAEETLRENASLARRDKARTELIGSVMTELEAVDAPDLLAERLVRSLVPKLADYAILEVPGREDPILAVAHRDERLVPVITELRNRQRAAALTSTIARAAGGEPQLVPHVTDAHLAGASDDVLMRLYRELAPRSHLAVPVDVTGEPGALLLGLSDPARRPYGPEELAIAEAIANRAGVLIARAQIREDEHRIGVRLQRALLPDALLSDPAIQVAASYQTSDALLSVGGDWYDTLALPDGRIVLAVGDVVGHGLDAAAAMSRMRIALAALAPLAPSAGALLSRLGEFAAGANGVEFATLTCGFLDPATGVLGYASAGHPPILVVGADRTTRWLSDGRSMPLGTVSDAAWRPQAETTLETGDVLVLYSDGLVERRREPITTGLARLAEAAARVADRPVTEVCSELLAETMFGSVSEDDAVILCVRFGRVSQTAFERRLPARPEHLAPTRQALRTWLERAGASESLIRRLLLTTGEALSNAVEHAFLGAPTGAERAITLTVDNEGEALRVSIVDSGRWSDRPSAPGRGRGLAVIAAVAQDLWRGNDGGGTTISFRLPIKEEMP